MFRDEKLELKVGVFIGAGIFLMFLIVFSIGDFYFFEEGYNFNVIFDFVNGISEDAPVRLAGVHVGEVKGIDIFHDRESARTRVKLGVWVKKDIQVETNAVARINTLGLLGEQYLELTPGTGGQFLKEGDIVIGKNPINVGRQMERMQEFFGSVGKVAKDIAEGKGTLGKLIVDDALYEDLKVIFGRLRDGEGTIGKLLVKDKIYNDMEAFVGDIKAHPWKLLSKPRSSSRKTTDDSRGTSVSTR